MEEEIRRNKIVFKSSDLTTKIDNNSVECAVYILTILRGRRTEMGWKSTDVASAK